MEGSVRVACFSIAGMVPPIATVGANSVSAANESFAMGRADSESPAATDKNVSPITCCTKGKASAYKPTKSSMTP